MIAALTEELSALRGTPIFGLVTTPGAGDLPEPVAGNAVHQLAPGETIGSVQRFLDHWTPEVGVFLGLVDKPLLLNEAAKRDFPLFLASPTRDTAAPSGKLPTATASALELFAGCFAPSSAEADLYRAEIEDKRVFVTGPLTDTTRALPCNEAERDTLAQLLGGRPVWLAASVDFSEIDMIEAAHRRATKAAHRLLLILKPIDASEGPSIRSALEEKGWQTSLRSDGGEPDPDVQVYLADTEDEMGLWYRLAPISYLGGTFSPERTPTDPFEPAALGSAILHGPEIGKAPYRFDRLSKAGAMKEVASEAQLGEELLQLLAPDKAAAMAHAGWTVTSESAHVVETLAAVIDARLDGEEAA